MKNRLLNSFFRAAAAFALLLVAGACKDDVALPMQRVALNTHAILAPSFATTLSFDVEDDLRRGRRHLVGRTLADRGHGHGDRGGVHCRKQYFRLPCADDTRCGQTECRGRGGVVLRAGFGDGRGVSLDPRSAETGRRRRLLRDAGREDARNRGVERPGQ